MTSRSAKPRNDESDTVQAAANSQDLWHFFFLQSAVIILLMIITIGVITIVIIY